MMTASEIFRRFFHCRVWSAAILLIILSGITVPGCAPTVIGSGGALGVAATSEKGISGAWSDTTISSAIKMGLYQKDPDLHRLVSVDVQNGEVFLAGAVPSQTMHLDALKIAWKPAGVTRVVDNIKISGNDSFKTVAHDSWITMKLKSALVLESEIQSRNYTITTVDGNVYLMGIAQNQDELNRVVDYARNISGVSKVTSYVQIKQNREQNSEGKNSNSREETLDETAVPNRQDMKHNSAGRKHTSYEDIDDASAETGSEAEPDAGAEPDADYDQEIN